MKQLRIIAKGWKNVLVKNDQVEKVATERMKICDGCPFKTRMLDVDVCGKCHCPLVAKTRSMESECPEGKWKVHT